MFFIVCFIQQFFLVSYIPGGVLCIGVMTAVPIIMFYGSLIANNRKAS